MKLNKSYVIGVITLLMSSTAAAQTITPPFTLKIANSTINHELPSGSAMVINQGQLIVAGDDSPWLFNLNSNFNITHKSQIAPFRVNQQNRINHKTKPDFESMTQLNYQGKSYYFVWGSGSKKQLREQAFLISTDGKSTEKLSLASLYTELHKLAGFTAKQKINIEGLANNNQQTFIFNRGNEGKNAIFSINTNELMAYLMGQSHRLNSTKVYQIQLPSINGVQACFSGADFWQDNNSIIFTASVEGNNQSSVNDGEIQGSFVGVLPLTQLNGKQIDLTPYTQLMQHDGRALLTKAESIAVSTQTKQQAKGYIVSDNDNGTSQFFSFTLKQ